MLLAMIKPAGEAFQGCLSRLPRGGRWSGAGAESCLLPSPVAPAAGKVPAHDYTDFGQTLPGFRQGPCPGEALRHEAPCSLVRERLTGGTQHSPPGRELPAALGVGTKNWKCAGGGTPGWDGAP